MSRVEDVCTAPALVLAKHMISHPDMGLPPTPPRLQNSNKKSMVAMEIDGELSDGIDSDGETRINGSRDSGACTDGNDFVMGGVTDEIQEEEHMGDNNFDDHENVHDVKTEQETPILSVDHSRTLKQSDLKEELKKRGLPTTGNKAECLERLITSLERHVPILETGDKRRNNMAGSGFPVTARWELIEQLQEDVLEALNYNIEGLAFHPPTSSDNIDRPNIEPPIIYNYPQLDYDLPPFIMQAKLPVMDHNGDPERDQDTGEYKYEYGIVNASVPNIDFTQKNHLDQYSSPCDWFNSFFPIFKNHRSLTTQVTLEDITTWSNQKAYIANSGQGGKQYESWRPFTVEEIMAHIGVYVLNGLIPSPKIEYKFPHKRKTL